MYTVTLPTFEGPLDLLLHLIERAKLDITTIALAHVADQYLAYVRTVALPDPQALADFVAMAARLLVIKSRALLPKPSTADSGEVGSEIDDGEALAQQLRDYQRYKQVAMVFQSWQDQGRQTFLRTAIPSLPLDLPPPALNHTVAELVAALERRVQLRLPLDEPTALSLPPRLTVAEVVGRVRERLVTQTWCSFDDLLALETTRQAIIVTFWAVLELWKRGAIVVEQDTLFGTISIGRGIDLENALTHIDSMDV